MCKGLRLTERLRQREVKWIAWSHTTAQWRSLGSSEWQTVLWAARPYCSLAITFLGPLISAYLHPGARIRMEEKEAGEGLRLQSGPALLQAPPGTPAGPDPEDPHLGHSRRASKPLYICRGYPGMCECEWVCVCALHWFPQAATEGSFLFLEICLDDPPLAHFHVTLRKEPGGMASWAKMS